MSQCIYSGVYSNSDFKGTVQGAEPIWEIESSVLGSSWPVYTKIQDSFTASTKLERTASMGSSTAHFRLGTVTALFLLRGKSSVSLLSVPLAEYRKYSYICRSSAQFGAEGSMKGR